MQGGAGMTTGLGTQRTATWAGTVAVLALALTTAAWAQSTPQTTPSPTPSDPQATTTTQQPAQPADTQQQPAADKPAPGTQPVAGDVPAPPPDAKAGKKDKHDKKGKHDDAAAQPDPDENVKVDPEKVVEVGSQKQSVKTGSREDVNAVGNRDIGGRGMGNWYSTDSEIKMGKGYASEIEKSTKFITDPMITEYVNRVGQNIVKNSDCKVPFTIKIIDSDEINAMALPGGFFYVNSGLILNADEEAEMAGVMAHEVAHVCAHHAAREMTRMNYTQIGMIPLIMMTGSGWAGYGIYEAAQLAIPITFLKFSRDFESEADYLGVQYMYRAGYDPQAFISFFEKVQALEKRKPGLVAKAFSDHPQTPDRILHSQEEIARILPAKDEYTVTTSEFEDVKARLARIENKRRLTDTKDKNKPSLRRASTGNDPNAQGTDSGDDRPTLHRREDQQQ
jgi:beta-barrel assembly-enhancing protease